VKGHQTANTSSHQRVQQLQSILLLIKSTTILNTNINNNTLQTTTTKMPSNVLSNMAARAKAHHESLNAAYQATYAPTGRPSLSTSATPEASRNASEVSASSQSSERNITKAWKALKKHHREMSEAYEVFYAPGSSSPASSRTSSAAPTPKVSLDSVREMDNRPRNYEKVWTAVKNRVVEHHKSVNNASAAVYGQ
jgi:hypothetical protein